eukprot:TRINITY_DN19794_c0_g8_i1.p1 TRINITY_DN19794_c0_g8~~TRINITY_DN19794_c0_g8_i1.p1  ORF type:complete len:274 (-),score=25.16 TRINITY_DN19794_c0_g8_i1:85-798(-)
MESTQQRADRELRRGAEFLSSHGQAVYPSRASALHLSQGVKWTNLGSLRQEPLPFASHGRLPHEAPTALGHAIPAGVMLPMVQAAVSNTPANWHKSWRKSVSVPTLEAQRSMDASGERPRTPPSPGALGPSRGPRWPGASLLEATDCAAHREMQASLRSRHCLVPESREYGRGCSPERKRGKSSKYREVLRRRQPSPGGANHINPFMNRFFDRQPNGGYFKGSGLAAPKVTDPASQR